MFTLPSEAQWEYSCLAGTDDRFYKGYSDCKSENLFDLKTLSEIEQKTAIFRTPCDDGHRTTAPVGSLEANPWGLFDMLGNVKEWTRDDYLKAGYQSHEENNPAISKNTGMKVVRGGSYWLAISGPTCRDRLPDMAQALDSLTGFRLIMTAIERK